MASSSAVLSKFKEKNTHPNIRIQSTFHPILSFEKQLKVMTDAYHFRILLWHLSEEDKKIALQQWIEENRASFQKEIHALAKPNISRNEQIKIADALLKQLQTALLLISDDFISENLNKSILEYCAQHKNKDSLARLHRYENEVVCALNKYFPDRNISHETVSHWREKTIFAYENISKKEYSSQHLSFAVFILKTLIALLAIYTSIQMKFPRLYHFIEENALVVSLSGISIPALFYFIKDTLDPCFRSTAMPAIPADAKMLNEVVSAGLTNHFQQNPRTEPDPLPNLLPQRTSPPAPTFPEAPGHKPKIKTKGTIGRNGATSSSMYTPVTTRETSDSSASSHAKRGGVRRK